MKDKFLKNRKFKFQKNKSGIFCSIIYLILLIFVSTECFSKNNTLAEPVITVSEIELSDINEGINIDEYLMLYKDESKKLGVHDIVNKGFVATNQSISLGYNNDADWIKFNVYSDHMLKGQTILKIDKLLLDSVTLYFFNKNLNKWDSIQGGTGVPHFKKPIVGFGTYFPLRIPPHDTLTFYMRCVSYSAKNFSVSIINPRVLHHTDMISSSYIGIYIGILLCITLYNIFIGFSIKDKLYLHYALANLFALMAGLANKGFFAYYFTMRFIDLIPYMSTISVGFWILFSSNFNIRILELKKYSRFAYYLMLSSALFTFSVIIGLNLFRLIGKATHYEFVSLGSLLFCITALIAGLIAWKNGSKYARFYLFGWAAVIIGISLYSIMLLGYFQKNAFYDNFYIIGLALEVLLLSFALADRYRFIQKKNSMLDLELQYKTSDLTKVVADNRLRHSFKVNLLTELNSILKSKEESIKQKLGSFITDLNIQIEADKKRNQLQANIDRINTEFEKKLKERFPNLTQSEVEICGYLKLKLSIKEIANLKRTSEDAVKMAKYRMNKKMMEEGSSIHEVILEV